MKTVSKELALDKQSLSKTDFLKKYGHLRPGTYEITSLRYDDDPDSYFDWSKTIELEQSEPLVLNRNQKEQIDKTLTRLGLKADASSIFIFLSKCDRTERVR